MKRLISLLLVFALLLAGCGSMMDLVDDSEIRDLTSAMLDALIAEDYETCRSLMAPRIDDATLASGCAELMEMLRDVESYELTLVQFNFNSVNGESQTQVRYQLDSDAVEYYVDVARSSGTEGLTDFYLTPVGEAAESTSSGGMTEPIQWVFLLIGVAEMAFYIWMLVDCFRRDMAKKWLWLVLMVFGMLLVSFTVSAAGASFRFNVGLQLTMTSLLRYSTGETVLNLHIPLGALIYFFKRKNLPPKDNKDNT